MNMTEKNKREIIVRTQNGKRYIKFELPLTVCEQDGEYGILMSYYLLGLYEEEKHAVHVMNYLLAQRNHYAFDDIDPDMSSIILNVPTDELVRQTPDENLLDGIPVKGNDDEPQG